MNTLAVLVNEGDEDKTHDNEFKDIKGVDDSRTQPMT